MLEAGIMLTLNANDAVRESRRLTDELCRIFSLENNSCHRTALKLARNDAWSRAMGSGSKTIVNIAVKYRGQHSWKMACVWLNVVL